MGEEYKDMLLFVIGGKVATVKINKKRFIDHAVISRLTLCGRPDQTLLDKADLIDDLRHFAFGRRECWAIQYQVDI